MPKALLIIDYTNDFVANDGALTVGKTAQQLDSYLTELAEHFYKNGDLFFLLTLIICMTLFTRNLSSSRHIILLERQDVLSMVKLVNGSRTIRTANGSTSLLKTATRPFKTPTWITTCASAILPIYGLVVSAPTSVSYIRPLAPTILTTS